MRETLRGYTKPKARAILYELLPEREATAIFYGDVEQESLNHIADNRLHCSESMVKKYRESGYKKLSDHYKASVL